MAEVVARLDEETEVVIPRWVDDNTSFLRWAASDAAPEKGKFGYFHDQLWFDHTMESILHNLIKTAIATELTLWNRQHGLGDYFGDGMLVSVPVLEFTSEPDGVFVNQSTWKVGRVQVENQEQSRILLGSPDMVLEVISKSTARKDLVTLRELYYAAAVKEYWLVDSRKDNPELVILKLAPGGYTQVRRQAGWSKSTVFGASFKLDYSRVDGRLQVQLAHKS